MVSQIHRFPTHCRAGAMVILLALLVGGAMRAAAPLSPKHKKWLEEDVVYIISDEEKKLFLSLPTDAQREQFIEQFWEIRDPNPATPENEYKIEHYRRIEYANAYFGFDVGMEGWRSDRGRIYIQLGQPNQRIQFISHGEVRPIELWFYHQYEHPSLPNAFNVLFFQPDSLTGYKLYSPYLDGPDKLVTRTGAENDPMGSYRFLRGINPEIARASVTLLTDEPVDPETFRPSLASDSMLTRIRNLPTDRFTKEKLERRRKLNEVVKVRMIYEPDELDVLAVPLRDPSGEVFVHVLLSLSNSLKTMVADAGKEKQLTATVSILVQTPKKETVFQQSHTNRYVYEDDYKWKQDWPVTYEDRLPLAPGEYEVDFVFRNEATQALLQRHLRMEVPALSTTGLRLSPLVVYESVHRGKPYEALPFQFADLKFVPTNRRTFGITEKLSVFFQIEDPSTQMSPKPAGTLKIEYTIGSLNSDGPRQTVAEEITKQDFTASGTVLHGKVFPLDKLSPGSYRLAVRIADPLTHQWASQTMSFQVVGGPVENRRVRLLNEQGDLDLSSGMQEYRRGLAELAQGRTEKGIGHLQNALTLNPELEGARNRLAEIYFERGEFARVVSLHPEGGLPRTTDAASVQRFVASFEKTGQPEKAIEIAQRALASKGPSADLYEELARLYALVGDRKQAEEMRDQARRLNHTNSEQTKTKN